MKKILLILAFLISFTLSAKDPIISTEHQNDVLEWVNWHRVRNGLTPLKIDLVVLNYAKNHTSYMVDNTKLSHDNFEHRSNDLNTKGIAENVARSKGTTTFVVKGWMSSEKHKNNILGDFTHTAISVQKGTDDKYYYTQIFIKR